MHKFYEDLKDYILMQDDKLKKTLIPYYETLYQLENYPEMKELLNDYTCLDDIDFEEGDNHWSMGTFDTYNSKLGVTYKIHLELGNMKGSFCDCEPSYKGYNVEKDCCGSGCDFYSPRVSIIKEVNVIDYDFQGYERDLWALEDKWVTEYDKELLHKQRLENVHSIETQIANLQTALEVAKSQLK